MIRVILTVLVLCVGAAISIAGYYYVLLPALNPDAQHSISGSQTYLQPLLYFGAMLLGMLFKSAYEILDSPTRHQGFLRTFAVALQSTGFLKAVVVSPFVFIAVLKAATDQPDKLIAVVLAFQNGFCWQWIFDHRKPGAAA
jgi:hypothetical protein